MNNIILMGPPGAGKTSVAKMLGEELHLPVYDFDDDHLESLWGCSVADKLNELGDDKFLEAEGEAAFHLSKENHIIALSGSNPLHTQSMKHIRTLGTVVYLDVPVEVIAARLNRMKVDRIVGMKSKSLQAILEYRNSFYENCYDVRVSFSGEDSVEEMTERVLETLNKSEEFQSTRGFKANNFSFLDVVRQGLSPDGGLFVPRQMPKFFDGKLKRLLPLSYQERALQILEKFPLGKMTPQELRKMIHDAYQSFDHKDVIPATHLENKQYLLEIFHGPTAAFKDAALQLTPKFFSRAVQGDGEKYLILAATSGDTGVAAIEGYKNEPNISVLVLYPKGGVSAVQEQQMLSSEGENVKVLGVKADFDFCQTSVKKIFNNHALTQELAQQFSTHLSSANSMNWGRLLPQVVYHISSYCDLVNAGKIELGDAIDVCIPSGNFGNLLAAVYAAEMGLPIHNFVCASNDNKVLTDFINTGIYDLRNRDLVRTTSPSIDILKSSNIERLLFLLSGDNSEEVAAYFKDLEEKKYFEVSDSIKKKLKERFKAGFCNDADSLIQVKETLDKTGILIDTHTAVAKRVADEFQGENVMVISSTAHWSKFAPAIAKALGQDCEGLSIEEIFEAILKVAPNAKVHKKVLEVLQKDIVHTAECEGTEEAIIEELKAFLKK